MTNGIVAQSSDRAQWLSARVGRFTASVFGDLIQDDSGRLKKKVQVGDVVFGGSAITLIQKVAMQRITGLEDQGPSSKQTERGEMLEDVAMAVLNRYWQPISRCAFIEAGEYAGASPDFVADDGEATGDIKCPWNAEKFMEFVAINDDDHEALLAYDKGYYWQIMMQAWCAGVNTCYLALFDDRQPLLDIDSEWLMSEVGYSIPSGKCAWVVRKFAPTDDIKARISRTLVAAEYLCREYETQYRDRFVAPVDDDELKSRIEALVDYGWERGGDPSGSSYIVLGARQVLLSHVSRMSDAEYMALLSDGLDEVLRLPQAAEEATAATEQAEDRVVVAASGTAQTAMQPVAHETIPEGDADYIEWLMGKMEWLRETIAVATERGATATFKKDMATVDERLKYSVNWLRGAMKDARK